MSFATLTFGGTASGSSGALSTTGVFTAQVTGNADGSVTGTWSFSGSYHDFGYPGTSGNEVLSGTLAGTGGASGPWSLALVTSDGLTSGSMTLSFANGQYALAG
jgi:hypothetical protein